MFPFNFFLQFSAGEFISYLQVKIKICIYSERSKFLQNSFLLLSNSVASKFAQSLLARLYVFTELTPYFFLVTLWVVLKTPGRHVVGTSLLNAVRFWGTCPRLPATMSV